MIKVMKYAPTETLNWVLDLARDVYLPTEIDQPKSEDFPLAAHRKGQKAGLFLLPIPRSHGGRELSVTDLAWVVRHLSHYSPSASATFIGNLLGLSAALLYANENLRHNILDTLKTDDIDLWSFAMTEGDAGSDLLTIRTHAHQTPRDTFVLTGEKNFITNATYSNHICVFAREFDPAGIDMGISCFYVPGNSPGLRRGQIMSKTGLRKANTGTIHFDRVEIPLSHRLGEPGAGLRILTHCLNRSKTLLGAMGVGIADRALELTTERLGKTERFGKSLLDQPVLRHELARLMTETEAAWLMTLKAATSWDEGKDTTTEASQAKWFSGKNASKVVGATIEYYGARGVFNDYEISRLWADAKVIEIVEGPSLVQELLIGKELLPKRSTMKPQTSGTDAFKLRPQDLKKAS